jgi:hypothetical protein
MPTTTNNGRAYIRRSQAIQWSFSAGAIKHQRRRYQLHRDDRGDPQGRANIASR